MSSYPDIFRSIFQTAIEVWPSRRITLTFLKDFVLDLKQYGRISINDVVIVSFIAVSLTLLRSSLTSVIFTPFAVNMKFSPKNIRKFPESSWKFLYYVLMYIYTCTLLFGKNYLFYQDPRTCWTDWSVGMSIPSDIYYLYTIQASFYIHSIYATLYMDIWRRDSVAMIIHHIVTIFLIGFSFAIRYYKIGVVVLFLHDISDVLLEFTKLCVCWKARDNKQYYWPEILINTGFILFAFSWFYCRLYLFPYKVLYPAGHYAVHMIPHGPFYYFFNGLLLFLFALDVWWFHFIILLIWRVLTGKSSEVEDTREVGTPEEGDVIHRTQEASTELQNGHTESNGTIIMNGKEHLSKETTAPVTKDGKFDGQDNLFTKKNNGLIEDLYLRHRQSKNAHEY